MIPANWVPVPGNDPSQLPVSTEEVAAHPEWRGQYVAGVDTRQFVMEQEANCHAWNCWMRRDAAGDPLFVSEPLSDVQVAALPVAVAARAAAGV